MSDVGGNINYGIPTSVYDTLNVAFGYDYIHISNVNGLNSTTGGTMPVPNPASPLTLQFVSVYPHPFNSFNATVGWTHATLDRAIFRPRDRCLALMSRVVCPLLLTVWVL